MRISENQTVILGAPGCGKTTALLSILDKCFQQGIRPEEVSFVSFTKKAATEAIERACHKFGFKPKDLPNFRTLHSLAFNSLGLDHSQVVGDEDFKILSNMLGVKFSKNSFEQLGEGYTDAGDVMRNLESISRARMETLEETYSALAGFSVQWQVFERYVKTYHKYKEDNFKLDFTDILTTYLAIGSLINTRVVFIDEAQDLSKLQWEVCKKAFKNCERVFIAGDDDQAIYKWAGANVEGFLELEGTRVVLNKSHRLPRKIHALAQAISGSIKKRIDKSFAPREDEGHVERVAALEYIPFSDASWLFLARNSYSLPPIERLLKAKGYVYSTSRGSSVLQAHINAIQTWEHLRAGNTLTLKDAKMALDYMNQDKFARGMKKKLEKLVDETPISMQLLLSDYGLLKDEIWHDALNSIKITTREYYLSVLRNNRKLTEPPKIAVSTIHASKGAEADNVLLMTDMSNKSMQEFFKNPDDEHRVFYVGVSRARQNLFILAPTSASAYKIPLV